MTSIRKIYQAVKTWAESTGFYNDELVLIEAADFGGFYGFAFKVKNIYNNAYWCMSKSTMKPTMFLPVQNPKIFNSRKKIDLRRLE